VGPTAAHPSPCVRHSSQTLPQCGGTVTSVAQLGSQLQAAPAEQPQNAISWSNGASLATGKGTEGVFRDTRPHVYAVADVITTRTCSMCLARNQSWRPCTLKASSRVKHCRGPENIFTECYQQRVDDAAIRRRGRSSGS
jgi:hypothetical protein